MGTSDGALDLYRELEALHRAMLETGRSGDWEAAARSGERASAVVAQLAALGPLDALDPAARESLADTIRQTLKLVADLQALAGPVCAEWAGQLAAEVQRNKLNDRYGL
jgi:flagellar protein FliT